MRFFVGLHHPADAAHVTAPAFISIHALDKRRSAFKVRDWILDSGAFSTILKHGGFPRTPEDYAEQIKRWSGVGTLLAAVTQDLMCEAAMLERTGLTVEDHQRLTIERYDRLVACDTGGIYIMPVLQGQSVDDYVRHLRAYGHRLRDGMWVGVGSVCKRNRDIAAVEGILRAIKGERPDLRLHAFGLKKTALRSELIRDALFSADSMAWSFAARMAGENGNDWRHAQRFADAIATMPVQRSLFPLASSSLRSGPNWQQGAE